MQRRRPLIIGADADYRPAIEAIKAGGVIAYPTETFYALGADPFSDEAVKAVFAMKGRPAGSPIPLIIGDMSMLALLSTDVPEAASGLMERFWPGPLTIVLRASPALPGPLTAGTGTIGVRLSGSAHARRLSNALGGPVTSTSANPSGARPAVTAAECESYFRDLPVIIDGGRLAGTKGSTIVDASGRELRLIREGEIPSKEIFAT